MRLTAAVHDLLHLILLISQFCVIRFIFLEPVSLDLRCRPIITGGSVNVHLTRNVTLVALSSKTVSTVD